MSFKIFDFDKRIVKAIDELGFKQASPVQEEAIPVVLAEKDIVAQAHTGTGKTAAFGLPILQMLELNGTVEAVVIVPTRELAMQVSDEIYKYGKYLGIKTATIYGGTSYNRQLKHINNSSVIVATPGRFIDLLSSGKINITPKFIVLDEADEMLDMGFLDDIKEIFTYMPSNRQTLMFSATMPEEIKRLSKRILNNPTFITITKNKITNENIKQYYYVVEEYERDDALIRLLDYKNPTKSIIFCRMKKEVDRLSTFLISQGIVAKGLHGDMEQRQREEVIRSFKNGNLEVLIATDVAARGLDVSDVSHVFNYHIPFDSDSYVHRIGRTGRAGKDGTAISIVTPHEFRALQKIQKSVGSKIENRVIPTIKDVQIKKMDSLYQDVKNQEIDPEVYEFIETLKEDFDLTTITYKLASMISKKEEIKGSNFIGKNKKQIKKLFFEFERDREDRKRQKNRRRDNRRRRNSSQKRGNSHRRNSR